MQWVSLAARLVLGVVFLIAGLHKVASPVLDVQAVQAFQVLPASIATLWAYGQPGLEIALGVLLIAGLGTRVMAILAGALLLVFIGNIVSAWARGLWIDCGCFSGGGPVALAQTQYPLDILRDTGLVVLAAVVAVWPPGRIALDELLGLGAREPATPAPAAGSASAGGTGRGGTARAGPVPPAPNGEPGP